MEETQDQNLESQSVAVQEPDFQQAVDSPSKCQPGQVDILLDTSVSIQVCLGETQIEVRQLLGLAPGSVVKLDRQVGQPIDLYLQGVKFATGQLVVVGTQLGVRIKEILPAEQLSKPAK